MDFLKKNKNGTIIIGIAVLLVIIIFLLLVAMLPDSKKSTWGNRLDGIKNYAIADSDIDKIKDSLKSSGKVSDVTYRLSGKTMNFIVTVNSGVDRATASNLTSHITDNLSSNIKGYYDVQVFFKGNGNDFPFVGYKHKNSTEFSFSNVGEE